MSKKFIFLLLGVVLISATVRLWGLGSNSFVADEFLDMNATYGYHKTGQWQAWDFNHNRISVRDNDLSDKRAWIYRIQVASLYNKTSFLAPTEATARLVSALWGIVMTLLLYGVTFSLTKNRWTALIASFLWAMSVSIIELNRTVRMYSMFAPVFLAFSYSLYMLLESRTSHAKSLFLRTIMLRYQYIIPTIILGTLSVHLHPLTGNILFVLFGYFVLRAFQVRKVQGYTNRYTIYVLVIIILSVTVAMLLPEQFAWFFATLKFFENHWGYIGHILTSYWHPFIGAGLIGLGAVLALKDTVHQSASAWIVVNFVVILGSAIFLWNRNVGAQYIFFVQAFGMMLAAIGISGIITYTQQQITSKNVRLYGLIVIVILVPYYGYFFLENNTYHHTSSSASTNYRKVFTYVKKNMQDGDVMITRNFRNYYFGNFDMQVFDFGSDRHAEALKKEGKVSKITEAYAREIVANNTSGWVVYSDNDEKFITKEAREFFDTMMHKVDDSLLVRGNVSVYYWRE